MTLFVCLLVGFFKWISICNQLLMNVPFSSQPNSKYALWAVIAILNLFIYELSDNESEACDFSFFFFFFFQYTNLLRLISQSGIISCLSLDLYNVRKIPLMHSAFLSDTEVISCISERKECLLYSIKLYWLITKPWFLVTSSLKTLPVPEETWLL